MQGNAEQVVSGSGHAVALGEHEVQMKVRVIRKDGSEEHYTGEEVQIQIDDDLQALLMEYRKVSSRALELEQIILKKMSGE